MRNIFDIIIHKLGVRSRLIPDKLYLSATYRLEMGSNIDWKQPRTFTEKLQWLKINNRKPLYTELVDKELVKSYVANRIGNKYIIPTLAIWDTIEEVDINKLPDQFVLKCTHDSGCVVICKDKKSFDWEKEKIKLQKAYKRDFYLVGREWPYKNVKRRVIAEKYMVENKKLGELADYKFYCFNGEPKYCQVIRDRSTKETIDFYDMDWNLMPFVGLNSSACNGVTPVNCPKHLEQMKEICRRLSDVSPFARVDMYIINDKEYFGEITFFPADGFGVFTPEEWNYKLGELLNLEGIFGGGINA